MYAQVLVHHHHQHQHKYRQFYSSTLTLTNLKSDWQFQEAANRRSNHLCLL